MSHRWLILLPACVLAMHGLVGHALFLFGFPVPSWVLLPVVLVAAAAVSRVPVPEQSEHGLPAPKWMLLAAGILIGGLACWSAWTSCITLDRSWDGLVSWSLRVDALGSPADLRRPFWTQPEVFAHSRDYPLLQPLFLASLGDLVGLHMARLFFPLLYLLLIALVATSCRRLGSPWSWTLLLAMGFAWTPAYMDVGASGIDSGYGDLLLAYAMALGAVGLLCTDAPLLFLACLLLPWIKPEGTVYAAMLGVILALGSDRRILFSAALGLGLSLALWLPLRGRLAFSTGSWLIAVGPLLFVGLLVAQGLLNKVPRGRPRHLLVGSVVVILLVAAGLGRSWLERSNDPILRDFLSNVGELAGRVESLPAIFLGLVSVLLNVKALGLTFVLLVPALLLLRGRESEGGRQLRYFVSTALLFLVLALLLSPERNLDHEIRSRLSRLVMHLVPVVWILMAQVEKALPIRETEVLP